MIRKLNVEETLAVINFRQLIENRQITGHALERSSTPFESSHFKVVDAAPIKASGFHAANYILDNILNECYRHLFLTPTFKKHLIDNFNRIEIFGNVEGAYYVADLFSNIAISFKIVGKFELSEMFSNDITAIEDFLDKYLIKKTSRLVPLVSNKRQYRDFVLARSIISDMFYNNKTIESFAIANYCISLFKKDNLVSNTAVFDDYVDFFNKVIESYKKENALDEDNRQFEHCIDFLAYQVTVGDITCQYSKIVHFNKRLYGIVVNLAAATVSYPEIAGTDIAYTATKVDAIIKERMSLNQKYNN